MNTSANVELTLDTELTPSQPAHAKSPEVATQRGFNLLAKPTGAVCSLDCKYCFFLSKELLYPGSRFRMADEMLKTYLRQLFESQPGPDVIVAWQGGEPTLVGLDFFKRSVEYAERFKRPGQRVTYSIQTNGTLLNDTWSAFFAEHGFLIGLSLDGPRDLHDAYRVDKAARGTFDQVKRAWDCLVARNVAVNVLCSVHAVNAEHALRTYRFFRDELAAEFIHFTPIVERVTSEILPIANLGWSHPHRVRPLDLQAGDRVTERSVRPEQWGRFLIEIFDEWVGHDVGRVFVQMFDAALAAWVGVPAPTCVFAENCGDAPALEHTGDIYSCDHFVEPKHRLGNIHDTPLSLLVSSEKQRQFGRAKSETLPRHCRECSVRFACNGECPRNRFCSTPDGEPGLNYLCAGYKAFFEHIQLPMRFMAELLRRGRYADDIMRIIEECT